MRDEKGFVFSSDILFALSFVLVILALSSHFLLQSQESASADISMARLGRDIVSVLDREDVLDSMNASLIAARLDQLLPANLNMSMTIDRYADAALNSTLEVNGNITGDHRAGSWIFVTFADDDVNYFHVVNYKVTFR